MRSASRAGWGLIALALALVAVYFLTRSNHPLNSKASLSIATALRASNEQGYDRAIEPRDFRFPADHGPHPEFRTEWWYYTGNLETAEGRGTWRPQRDAGSAFN
jgi:predicted secreted hydrolase